MCFLNIKYKYSKIVFIIYKIIAEKPEIQPSREFMMMLPALPCFTQITWGTLSFQKPGGGGSRETNLGL